MVGWPRITTVESFQLASRRRAQRVLYWSPVNDHTSLDMICRCSRM
jgi:hypothetical protein